MKVAVFLFLILSTHVFGIKPTARRCSPDRLTGDPVTHAHRSLAEFDHSERPWRHIESLDEQPIAYIGGTPRELALGKTPAGKPIISNRMFKLGEVQAQKIRKSLGMKDVELEMWPSYDGWGELTWAYARYRESARHAWKWLDVSHWPEGELFDPQAPTQPVLPKILDPQKKDERIEIFAETAENLYQRPSFGSCVWTTRDGKRVVDAWLPPDRAGHFKDRIVGNPDMVARVVAPPARFNEKPVTFNLKVGEHGVEWGDGFQRVKDPLPSHKAIEHEAVIKEWPKDFDERYWEDLRRFTGETRMYSPLTGKLLDFKKMGSLQKDNQLRDFVAWLERDYRNMGFGSHPGLELHVQEWEWNGVKQQNLIVKIKGKLPPGKNKPIVLADHIDKAIAEDTYDETHRRETNPGGDDNSTAIAALRRSAVIFSDMVKKGEQPDHDIWLVHFTGEEYPGSSLGARHFYSELLKQKQDLSGVIQMDMIGWRAKGDRHYQICPGNTDASRRLAQIALGTANNPKHRWNVLVPAAWSRTSYITETDAAYSDLAGYPTILMNEHMNLRLRKNPFYHQHNDFPELSVDNEYATTQSRNAIETAAGIAFGRVGMGD